MRCETKLCGLHLPSAPKGADQTGLMGVSVYRSVTRYSHVDMKQCKCSGVVNYPPPTPSFLPETLTTD